MALKILTCLGKTFKLFYSFLDLWKSSVPSQYHLSRPPLSTSKAEQSRFAGSFLPCLRGSPLREGDGRWRGFRHFLGPVFRTFCPLWVAFFTFFFYPLQVPFLSIYAHSRSQVYFSAQGLLK